jgi:hypothetical protein
MFSVFWDFIINFSRNINYAPTCAHREILKLHMRTKYYKVWRPLLCKVSLVPIWKCHHMAMQCHDNSNRNILPRFSTLMHMYNHNFRISRLAVYLYERIRCISYTLRLANYCFIFLYLQWTGGTLPFRSGYPPSVLIATDWDVTSNVKYSLYCTFSWNTSFIWRSYGRKTNLLICRLLVISFTTSCTVVIWLPSSWKSKSHHIFIHLLWLHIGRRPNTTETYLKG